MCLSGIKETCLRAEIKRVIVCFSICLRCGLLWRCLGQFRSKVLATKIQKLRNRAACTNNLIRLQCEFSGNKETNYQNWTWLQWVCFQEQSLWSRCALCCVLCQVTWLNADDPSTGIRGTWWLHITIMRTKRITSVLTRTKSTFMYDTEQLGPEWRLAVPCGRELWLSSMSSLCSASRADMRCFLHQVRMSFPVG